ncbi:MAG: GNAT family N-acetyltransferase [Gaiellales bacterium]
MTVEAVAPLAPWADRAWADVRGGRHTARLDLDAATGMFELRLPEGRSGAAAADLLARLDGLDHVESVVPRHMTAVAGALTANGFRLDHEVWQMARRIASTDPAPRWPEGISVRTYDDARDARPVHALLTVAFASGHELVAPFERWHERMTSDAEFDPAWWWVAERAGEPAGVALCWMSGWLKDLAVRPDARGQGLGEALCRHAFREMAGRGVRQAGLKVDADNPTGAPRLYERVGMRRDRVFDLFVRGR